MKKLLDIGNRYAAQSTWVDFALVKLCLAAMGIFIGLFIPKKAKLKAAICSGAVFAGLDAFLTAKLFRIAREDSATPKA